ncbi:MAG: hypothetical protein HXY24_11730 [Rubrivivax sp.]|nr:hypothetical protein [Rubrivivax sp.]
MAAELGTRWRLTIHQSQVSTHKTKHLDPSIADAYETFAGHLAMLEVCGELPPEKLAAMYLQLAMIKLGEQLQQSADAEISAKLGGAIAQLGRALQGSAKLPLELELADLDARQARTRAALAEGQYREAFARWVEAHYPDLVPTLAAQPAAAVLQEQGDDRDAS